MIRISLRSHKNLLRHSSKNNLDDSSHSRSEDVDNESIIREEDNYPETLQTGQITETWHVIVQYTHMIALKSQPVKMLTSENPPTENCN